MRVPISYCHGESFYVKFENNVDFDKYYACGPQVMLKYLSLFNGNGYVACPDGKYESHILTDFYRYLWYKYLSANPELVAYAKQFDKFNDMFRGKCINCQADCIEAFVKENNLFYECIKMLQNYDNQVEELLKKK